MCLANSVAFNGVELDGTATSIIGCRSLPGEGDENDDDAENDRLLSMTISDNRVCRLKMFP